MTTGEKITKLRRENNHTQERLADILNVSRQAVSRWESDLAFPETDKLIRLSELYGVSVDYLLKDGQEEVVHKKSFSFPLDYRSKTQIFGMPLVHIHFGRKTAKGFVAIGFRSIGIISIGLLSLGLLSIGLLSIGLFAFGCLCLGILSIGAIGIGIFSIASISIGIISIGALSIGQVSCGALAIGKYFAYGDYATGGVTIGKTNSSGLYAFFEDSYVKEEVLKTIEEYVPKFFWWFCKLFI